MTTAVVLPKTQTDRERASGPSLLTPAGLVIAHLIEDPTSTIRQLARASGRTERAVWDIVQRLEAQGLIRRYRSGRRNRYEIDRAAVFGHLRQEGGPLFGLHPVS